MRAITPFYLLATIVPMLSCRSENCDTSPNPAAGDYIIADASRPTLIGAPVMIMDETLTVRYRLRDGTRWVVRYRVASDEP